MPNPLEDLPQIRYVEIARGAPEQIHQRLAHLPRFGGVTQKDGKTYACFTGEPPASVKSQLHKIAGKP